MSMKPTQEATTAAGLKTRGCGGADVTVMSPDVTGNIARLVKICAALVDGAVRVMRAVNVLEGASIAWRRWPVRCVVQDYWTVSTSSGRVV
ncbi:hypothetical protein GCM10022233_73160 [Streptomyces shaanxiensis]|uniref:Uncharacterized protein n=1 Tax=Streptomyces shaanxiensis TaxID=653357 RepID=A0ABP7W7G8_9ACTN